MQSTKRLELSTVIITVHGGCQIGDCIQNLDSLMGVFPLLVFPDCGYDEMMVQIHRNIQEHLGIQNIVYTYIYVCVCVFVCVVYVLV